MKDNNKKWIKDHEKNKPETHYLENLIPFPSGTNVLFWDKNSPDLKENNFSLKLREDMYLIISKKSINLCNRTLSYLRAFDFDNATMEDHKQFKLNGLRIYRKYLSFFHPDK